MSFVLPTPTAFNILKGEVQLIDVELPRLFYQECCATHIVHKSNSNAGAIIPSDQIVDTVNTLSKTALCINGDVLNWLEAHRDL